MSMKKIIIINSFLFVAVMSFSQQRPHYTQYVLNNYILNPALSGIENYTDIKLSVRDQWVGLNGAPKTCYLTIHTPLGKKDEKETATSVSADENPRGKTYWEEYKVSPPHHGIGLSIINDKTGLYQHFTATVSYAYHIGLTDKTSLSAGFAGGFGNVSYDRSKATPDDPNDLALGNGKSFSTVPNLNAGIWLYSPDYFLGAAVHQVVPQKINWGNENTGFKLFPHYFITTGYRFLLNEDINVIPSLMLKYLPESSPESQFDLNAKFQYRNLFWLGANYRFQDGYGVMAGLFCNRIFNVAYSYDFTTTKLNTASHGTHELMIGIILGNKTSDGCPMNVW